MSNRATAAALVLALGACKEPTGADTGGLVVVSETAPLEYGDPPACDDTAATTGDPTSGGTTSEDTSGHVSEDMSGEAFCAARTSAPACEGIAAPGGVCRWLDVVPVYPGTCDVTRLYRTCVFVPDVPACDAPTACGQIGLGVYGRRGCDGAVELLVVGPSDGLCGSPAGWPLCDGDDPPPECSCACS
ncbi:MAG TPA: hypothetical protein VIK91_21660 [Nannocystis sp.]